MSEESITENDLLLTERVELSDFLNPDPDSLNNPLDNETHVKIPLEYEATAQEESNRFPFEHGPQRLIPGLPPGKKYHVFISCSSSDIEETNKICEELEKRFFLRCMQFDRDFVPGKLLDDNIHAEMTKSVKVLICLSPTYVTSSWCMNEAYEAIQLSYSEGEKMKIIPVLLRPTEDVELPSVLKRYRYIDAQKEDDVPAKIMEAYYHSGAVDAIQMQEEQGLTAEEIKNQNGARLMSKTFLKQRPYLEKGYVFETESLTFNESEYLKTIHEKCEEQFEAAASFLANQRLLRFYKVFVITFFTMTAGAVLAAITVSSIITFSYAAVLFSGNEKMVSDTSIPLAMSLGLVAWPLSVFIIYLLRKKATDAIRRKLWHTVNKKYFRETKCLILYDDIVFREPCMMVIRYNTTPCQEYLAILLERKYFQLEDRKQYQLDDDEITIMAAERIEEKLEQLQSSGLLAHWFQLGVYDYNRHNTWLRKQCLCQMLEKDIVERKIPIINV
ncbi:uncharacterized protein LOC125674231 isoform X1 [Ostrea edulis]|uniref:uncharacterized protein LOC125674231 isoform X1 n=1 Tax=Ostrea edulis TaxID=37623 RepID=UPI00209653C9|nr:uncharacterized protein LOC125674231 isoform X1 [Ostrea edulis]